MPVLAAVDTHSIAYAVAGLAALGAALLPRVLRSAPLSTPMVCLALGVGLFLLPLPLDHPDPLAFPQWAEYLTELGVIVALMGAGLKLDRLVGWRSWSATWRLLALTMPLSIVAAAVLGWWLIGLLPAAAVLLGASLAPTDPVLASDVQVGPPGESMQDVEDPSDAEGEVRFALTSEAGLNDALAFPFTNAAIAMAVHGAAPGNWLGDWLLVDVLYRLGVGLVAGIVVGRLLARLMFGAEGDADLARSGEGFLALAVTLVAYGATELVGGYGFLAVFVAALTLRDYERDHEYHDVLHGFIDSVERLLMALLLVLLGGAVMGGILRDLTWEGALVGLAIVLLVRPIVAGVSLLGSDCPRAELAAIAFFGIRGVGSAYYLAYAVASADFIDVEVGLLWSVTVFVILVSVVLHGSAAAPVLRRIDARRR